MVVFKNPGNKNKVEGHMTDLMTGFVVIISTEDSANRVCVASWIILYN